MIFIFKYNAIDSGIDRCVDVAGKMYASLTILSHRIYYISGCRAIWKTCYNLLLSFSVWCEIFTQKELIYIEVKTTTNKKFFLQYRAWQLQEIQREDWQVCAIIADLDPSFKVQDDLLVELMKPYKTILLKYSTGRYKWILIASGKRAWCAYTWWKWNVVKIHNSSVVKLCTQWMHNKCYMQCGCCVTWILCLSLPECLS